VRTYLAINLFLILILKKLIRTGKVIPTKNKNLELKNTHFEEKSKQLRQNSANQRLFPLSPFHLLHRAHSSSLHSHDEVGRSERLYEYITPLMKIYSVVDAKANSRPFLKRR